MAALTSFLLARSLAHSLSFRHIQKLMCHVLVAGGCRQEQQKEMQEHKEEMQDEMGGRGQDKASQEAGAGAGGRR